MMLKRVCAILLGIICLAGAQEDFEVKSVVHPVVAKLAPPKLVGGLSDTAFAVSTTSAKASKHVQLGMAYLNAPWDFEAYRHFCAAAQADPGCLMAYWGITMSLAGRNHEFYRQRKAAIERMVTLLEASKGVPLEQGYAYAAAQLITDGVRSSGEAFQAIARQFPNDVQSRLLGNFLTRDGFDGNGEPRIGQQKASESLKKMVAENPDNLSVISFWVTSQSESPLKGEKLRADVLPYARKLVEKQPESPIFHLVLTHVEAKCGNAALALAACQKAIDFYEDYMKAEGVSRYDCDGWIRAKIYQANLYTVLGHYEKSLPVTEELASLKVDPERIFSRGASLLMWEGRTIGARLTMGRSSKKEWSAAQKQLEALSDEEWHEDKSFAAVYRDNLAFYFGVRKALAAKDLKVAEGLYGLLIEHAKSLEGMKEAVAKTSSYSDWVRARDTLGVAVSELRGMLAMQDEGAARLGAINYIKGAIERQGSPTNLLPAAIDYPMQARLGAFYLALGEPGKAALAYREGLDFRPNHVGVLEGYRNALLKLDRKDAAEQIRERIEFIKG